MERYLLELKNINKKIKDKNIIENLSLELPYPSLTLLIGDNGLGKTTLLNIISGLVKYEGSVELPSDISRDDIYYMKANDDIYDNLSSYQKASIILSIEELNVFHNKINELGLDKFINRKFKTLSSGEKQKIELIMALSSSKKILLLDEPFEYIDKESKPIFIDLVKNEGKKRLIIETAHYKVHEADVIVNLASNEILKADIANIEMPLINSNREYKKHPFLGFKASFNIAMIFSWILLLLTTVLSSFSFSILEIKNIDILKSLNNEMPFTIAYNSDLKTNSILLNLDGDSRFKMRVSRENGAYDKLILAKAIGYESDDNTVYISDYLYDVGTYNDSLSFYEYAAYEPTRRNYYFIPGPYKNVNYEPKIDIFELNNVDYNVKIFKTNYKEYLPDDNLDGEALDKQKERFCQMAYSHYLTCYMPADLLIRYLEHRLDNDSKAGSYFLCDEVLVRGNDQYYGAIGDDEFSCDVLYAAKKLGLDVDPKKGYLLDQLDKYLGMEFNININGINKVLKMAKPIDDFIITSKNGQVLLSDNNYKYYYEEIKPNTFEYISNNYKASEETLITTDNLVNLKAGNYMYMEEYQSRVIKKEAVDSSVTIASLVSGLAFVILFGMYFYFRLLKEIRTNNELKVKGLPSSAILTNTYLVRAIIVLIALALGIVIGISLASYALIALGIL